MASLFPALLLCAASVHPDTINDIARSRVASILMLWLKLFLKGNTVAMAKVLSVIYAQK